MVIQQIKILSLYGKLTLVYKSRHSNPLNSFLLKRKMLVHKSTVAQRVGLSCFIHSIVGWTKHKEHIASSLILSSLSGEIASLYGVSLLHKIRKYSSF